MLTREQSRLINEMKLPRKIAKCVREVIRYFNDHDPDYSLNLKVRIEPYYRSIFVSSNEGTDLKFQIDFGANPYFPQFRFETTKHANLLLDGIMINEVIAIFAKD